MRDRATRQWLMMGIGLFITSTFVFPIYWIIVTSLKGQNELFRSPPSLWPIHINTAGYTHAFSPSSDLWHQLGNSLQIAFGTTALTLVLGVPAAYALARFNLKGTRVILLLLLVMQMFPSIMLALPLFVFFVKLNLVDSLFAVILAVTTRTLPFAILVLRPFFLSLPRSLEDAAAVDGSSPWMTFFRIIMPLTRPGILTVGVLTFLGGWGEFLFSLTLLTSNDKLPLTIGIYRLVNSQVTDWNYLMALAVVATVPIIFLFIFAQRYITSGLALGATNE